MLLSLLGESPQKYLSARHIDQLVTQGKTVRVAKFLFFLNFFLTATTRHQALSVARKRSTKRLKHTGNLFRKKLQLIGVC